MFEKSLDIEQMFGKTIEHPFVTVSTTYPPSPVQPKSKGFQRLVQDLPKGLNMTAIIDPLLIPTQARASRVTFSGSSSTPADLVVSYMSRAPQRATEQVYRRRRMVVAAVSALAAGSFAFMALGGSATANQPGAGNTNLGSEVVVKEGDTLWAIARRVAPTGNIANLVDELVRMNGADLHVGQVIRIP